jgi:hypothetical protein
VEPSVTMREAVPSKPLASSFRRQLCRAHTPKAASHFLQSQFMPAVPSCACSGGTEAGLTRPSRSDHGPASQGVVYHVQLRSGTACNSPYPDNGTHGPRRGSMDRVCRRLSPGAPLASPQPDATPGAPDAVRFRGRITGVSHRASRLTVSI